MSSTDRYRTGYGTTGSFIEQGSLHDAQEAHWAARRAACRIRVTEDAWVRNVLLTIAVCGACLGLAVFLGRVPIAEWMLK